MATVSFFSVFCTYKIFEVLRSWIEELTFFFVLFTKITFKSFYKILNISIPSNSRFISNINKFILSNPFSYQRQSIIFIFIKIKLITIIVKISFLKKFQRLNNWNIFFLIFTNSIRILNLSPLTIKITMNRKIFRFFIYKIIKLRLTYIRNIFIIIGKNNKPGNKI